MKKHLISLFFGIILIATSLTTFDIIPAFAPTSAQIADVRGKDFRNIAYANGTHVATFGLEEWVSSNTGYVPYILNQNSTHYLIDNKQFPMAISKANCGVTVYNNDKNIAQNPSVLIEKEWWNVGWKPASSGSWTEIDYSATSCIITPVTNSSGIFIQTSKTNSDGTLAVTYAKRTDEPFKTFQKWTNGNAGRTNHIFKFMEKYDNIHLDAISTQVGRLTSDGTVTITFSQMSQSQLINIEKSGFNLFNLDLTKAYNNFQSLTATKSGGLLDATFDYGRNLSILPVSSSQSLDPTFGYTGSTAKSIVTTSATGSACPSVSTTSSSTTLQTTASGSSGTCTINSYRWDISSIPDDSTITDTVLRYDISSIVTLQNCDYNQISTYPRDATAQGLWDDILNTSEGTTYVDNNSGCTTVGNDKTLDLGTSADTDVTNQLSVNWWAVGVAFDSMVRAVTTNTVTFTNQDSVELQITYTLSGTPAPTSSLDSTANTGIGACASKTTLLTEATTFPAGDNIIISTILATSTDAGNESVDLYLNKTGTGNLVTNQASISTGTSGKASDYALLYKDTGAAANPTYTVSACRSATAVDTEAYILIINGLTSTGFTDSGATSLATTDTTLGTVNTSFPAGSNVIIASVQIVNGGTGQDIAVAGIRLKNNGGTEIASNQYAMSLGTAAPTQNQEIFLIGVDSGAGASPTYTVTGKAPTAGATGEVKILVFQPRTYSYNDGSSVALGTGAGTTITTTTSSFATKTELGMILDEEVDDTDAGVESLPANALNLQVDGVNYAVKTTVMEAFAASGNAGDGFRGVLVGKDTNNALNAVFAGAVTPASATGLNGAGQIIAFTIANPILQTNCDACNTGTQPNTGCCIFGILPYFHPQLTLIRVWESLGLW